MTRRALLPLLLAAAPLAACARRPAPAPAATADTPAPAAVAPESLLTRAERTGYRETSSHDDVLRFVAAVRVAGRGRVQAGVLGRSTEGREIPFLVLSRTGVRTPAEARATGKPIVWVQANIHAGEVEGKEALQALVRDLAREPRAGVLDSIVLVAVPIYNSDGNEKLAPQSRNRTEQNGPERVGERANGQGLDLNRDYVKAEAPETRAALAFLDAWDPDLFVDLHTTDGSYHGYALTYSPSLHPAAALGAWTQDTLLPELRRRVQARHGFATYPYGNFANEYGADVNADTTKPGWFSYDHRPRFGTNYYGLRNRVAVLSEAFSHDPFERRVKATYAFVRELLSLAAEQGAAIRAREQAADARAGLAPGAREVALAAVLTRTPVRDTVIAEDLVADPDSVPDEPGVPRGLRRTGRFRALVLPVHDRFDAVASRPLPAAWAFDGALDDVARRLAEHGVRVERLASPWTGTVVTERVDSVVTSPRPFQKHHEVRVVVDAARGPRQAVRTLSVGTYVVRGAQPRGALAAVLLDPRSDDGLATWNVLDAVLRPGAEYPVLRLITAPPLR